MQLVMDQRLQGPDFSCKGVMPSLPGPSRDQPYKESTALESEGWVDEPWHTFELKSL